MMKRKGTARIGSLYVIVLFLALMLPVAGTAAAPGDATLTIQVEGQGTVEPEGGAFGPETEVSLTVHPEPAWAFAGWFGPDGRDVTTVDVNEGLYQIRMTESKTVTAVFVATEARDDEAPGPTLTGDVLGERLEFSLRSTADLRYPDGELFLSRFAANVLLTPLHDGEELADILGEPLAEPDAEMFPDGIPELSPEAWLDVWADGIAYVGDGTLALEVEEIVVPDPCSVTWATREGDLRVLLNFRADGSLLGLFSSPLDGQPYLSMTISCPGSPSIPVDLPWGIFVVTYMDDFAAGGLREWEFATGEEGIIAWHTEARTIQDPEYVFTTDTHIVVRRPR